MKRALVIVLLVVSQRADLAVADSFQTDVSPLVKSSCAQCHDGQTETGLDLVTLGHDLSDPAIFRVWEKVFDRVSAGEMPPETEERPDAARLKTALDSLRAGLTQASAARRARVGRVPARRLTKLEFGNSLRDLLRIEGGNFTSGVPDEVEAGSFDTVGANQRISAVHMESYLQAADQALSLAIRLGRNPYRSHTTNFAWLNEWHDKPINLGGSVTRKLEDGAGIALFRDIDYLTGFQFRVRTAGRHRLTTRLAAFQSKTPVTAKFIVKDPTGGARLVKSIDLDPSGEPEMVVFETVLKPGDTPYVTFDLEGKEPFSGLIAAGGSKNYKGRGLAIHLQKAEGPLFDVWPPASTRNLLAGVELSEESGRVRLNLTRSPLEHVSEIVRTVAPKIFRRPVSDEEIAPFIELAKPAIEEGRPFHEVVRVPIRSMLSSPQFLLFGGEAGVLDAYALASRLSYFLWKSVPDEQLMALAEQGTLSEAKVLSNQVDRMLADEKSSRFVDDFLGQWLHLNKVNATTPDDGLYPEFDELLQAAIPQETILFFSELLEENLSLTNLIDSDFTFLNRRLSKHYKIDGVEGQDFRRVALPADLPRGGVLTQAAILKTTANGTTTSPVMRGNFVLSNILGTPPSPPPPDVGSIEPDTRGKTTIREILAAHRNIETCAKCHREIDPPGFALESFDPIGGFRTHYRASGGTSTFGGFVAKLGPKKGLPVDASGVTSDGHEFAGIEEFKQHLLGQKDQIARNFISQLVVYSTGGEIQFADRADVEAILDKTKADDFRVRDVVHAVVQSQLFRNK